MKLNQLPKTTTKSKKRLGRGYGSGVGGHTSTRGQKGQKSRSDVKIWFEGGQLPTTKKIPFLRGKDRFKTLNATTLIINLSALNSFKAGSIVTKDALVKAGLVSLNEAAIKTIKILGTGDIDKPITLKGLDSSKSAADKITKAGGQVENN